MNTIKLIDNHTHIIYGVDDGPSTVEESIEMIELMLKQGVETVIATPHIQTDKSINDKSIIVENFTRLKYLVSHMNIKLYLGYEIMYRYPKMINYSDYTINNTNYLLIEFSTKHEENIEEVVFDLHSKGFIPIVAHAERYEYLKIEDYRAIKNSGGLIQINAGSIIYKKNRKTSRLIKRLIKEKLVDIIASDCHGSENRVPNIKEAYEILIRSKDKDYINSLFNKVVYE